MSSDDYFDEEGELDSAELAQLDAIEAAHSNSQQVTSHPNTFAPAIPLSSNTTPVPFAFPPSRSNLRHEPALHARPPVSAKPAPATIIEVDADDSYDDFLDDIDPAEFERLDKDVENAYKHGTSQPRLNAASGSVPTRQLTLFGDTLPIAPPRPQRSTQQGGQSKPPRSPRNPFGQKSRKTKKWDHTAFAKSGWRLGKSAKGKGKEKAKAAPINEEAGEEESAEEFEQYPAPSLKYPAAPPPRCKLKPDLIAAKKWIFPINRPKRDYQFNIIRESLFENTLVAVPTGLGKTFIAGVVMLNYHRWFPEGKVVFVAPTKPLVAQQIDACHKTCGISGLDAVELTGQNPRAARAKAWAEKRVFYMTPQTLINDLTSENCDPTDIVLLVIDEAHKGTGDYAYAQVVRYLMAHNGHFRILALTATPGSNAEAVQAIVDSLHISHIEIRDENSIDLRGYMQRKEIVTHVVKMTEDVIKVRDRLVKVMDKFAKPLLSGGILYNYNPITFHPYSCHSAKSRLDGGGNGKKKYWAYSLLTQLSSLARAMGYLLECSVALCHQSVQELTADPTKKSSESFRSDPLFQDLVEELERQSNSNKFGFAPHPKMEKLESLALDYFAQADCDAKEIGGRPSYDAEGESQASNAKMMVFTNFRASVEEIVKVLNGHGTLIRATAFIGQGTDKNGKKGIAQKEQLEVIQKFKDGVYNVLVSTSIGEEGLDIGEVDMIICYDAQKTPIRMLQRVGRTGRQRAGKVAVLLSEDREESNWQKAKNDYESVQTSIIRGESLELFGDVERLLPENIKPECIEMNVKMEAYVPDTKRAVAPKGTKRKRNTDVNRNIPEGASTGFISSAKLIPKGTSKKRKIVPREYDLDDMEDDEDDLAIEAGVQGALAAGNKSKSNDKGKAPAKKPRKKAGTSTSTSRRKKTIPAKSLTPLTPTLSQLSQELKDDANDMEIETGIQFSSPARPLARLSSFKFQGSPSFSDAMISTHSSPPRPAAPVNESEQSNAWLLNGDSDIEIVEDAFTGFVKGSKVDRSPPTTPKESHSFRRSPLSHVPTEKIRTSQNAMPPPPLARLSSDASPELSFAIRDPARRKRKVLGALSPSPTQPSLFLPQTSSPAASPPRPPARRKEWRRGPTDLAQVKMLLDIEAEVSGDDVPGGSSDTEGVESESDRRFVQELAATQASPSYDQTMAYRNSLFTQAPRGGSGPKFVSKPVRRGAFGNGREGPRTHLSSSPHQVKSSDQYSMDSFVVEDDDDIMLQDSSDL